MVHNQDFPIIKKISVISLILLAVVVILCYFIFSYEIFLAVAGSASLAFLLFLSTLMFYRWLRRRNPEKLAQFIFFSFFIKIAFLGLAFYLIFRFGSVNMLAFALSFVIFFTIFLNLEILFIYKKILFK